MKYWIRLFLLFFSPIALSFNQCTAPKVIYITFDGLAPNEVTQEHFPYIYNELRPYSELIGTEGDYRHFNVGTIPISLPSYMSQMTGMVTLCLNNECPRVKIETLPEKIKREHHLDKYQVATFSTWPQIANSVEHIEGSTYVNNGNLWHDFPFYHPYIEKQIAQINNGNVSLHRADDVTFKSALIYLQKQNPKFLWIALDETDGYAHKGDRDGFIKTLHRFDGYLKTLNESLLKDPCRHNTWVVVTTDHGRGLGKNWTKHGVWYPASFNTWALVYNARALIEKHKINSPYDLTKSHYSTLSIKPMIEHLLKD